jgi:hypothetical protein
MMLSLLTGTYLIAKGKLQQYDMVLWMSCLGFMETIFYILIITLLKNNNIK